MLKRILKFFGRLAAFVLAATLFFTFWPEISGLLRGLLPGVEGKGIVTSTQLTHELRSMGMLTTAEYTDTGAIVSTVPAALLGDVQKVTIPYEYKIYFGVDLEQAEVEAVESALFITLPEAEMLEDKLTVTGEVEVWDFFFPLTEDRYQSILNERTLAFRAAYLEDPSPFEAAYGTATERIGALLASVLEAQGAREEWTLVFRRQGEAPVVTGMGE